MLRWLMREPQERYAQALGQGSLPVLLGVTGSMREQHSSRKEPVRGLPQELLQNRSRTTSELLCARCMHPPFSQRLCRYRLCIALLSPQGLVL